MRKPKIRIEQLGPNSDGAEYVVREYGPRCSVDLFRGDIAECQDYAQEYVEDLRQMGFAS